MKLALRNLVNIDLNFKRLIHRIDDFEVQQNFLCLLKTFFIVYFVVFRAIRKIYIYQSHTLRDGTVNIGLHFGWFDAPN